MIAAFLDRQFGFRRRLRADERAVAATEFALIAPLMIALYVGVVQFSQALEANRKFNMAANQVADLVSQDDVVSDEDLYEFFTAGKVVMLAFDSDALNMRISSVRRRNDGTVDLLWSEGRGMQPLAAPPSIPANVLEDGESVVMVETEYEYATPILNATGYSWTFRDTVHRRPRRSDEVTRQGQSTPIASAEPQNGSGSGGGSQTAGGDDSGGPPTWSNAGGKKNR